MVLTIGAGTITYVAGEILSELEQRGDLNDGEQPEVESQDV